MTTAHVSSPDPAAAPAPRAPASPGPGPGVSLDGTHPARRRVIDAPTRMFHALFALSFVGAYLSAEGERWRALHLTLGYTLAALLAARVLYGLFGPRHARLAQLWRRLAAAPRWLAQMVRSPSDSGAWPATGRQAQNLAMAAVIALILAAAPVLTLSGYVTEQLGEVSRWGHYAEELHEALANMSLALVLAHLGLLLLLSVLRQRNQALPMLTGYIEGPGPDVVTRPRRALAAMLLVAVLGLAAWLWQQSSTRGLLAPLADDPPHWRAHHDDDDD